MREQKLDELLKLMREINEKFKGDLPSVLSLKEAAVRIGVGLTKLRTLIDSGVIVTRKDLGKEMVPASEVLRLAQAPVSAGRKPRPPGRGKKEAFSPSTEVTKLRQLRRAKLKKAR